MSVLNLKRHRKIKIAKRFVLKHLERYSLPGDTLAGISKSWLEQVRIDIAVEEVAHALSELVVEHKVEKREVGREVLFIKKPAGRNRIISLIKDI